MLHSIISTKKNYFILFNNLYFQMTNKEYYIKSNKFKNDIQDFDGELQNIISNELNSFQIFTKIINTNKQHQFIHYFYLPKEDKFVHVTIMSNIYADVRGCQCNKRAMPNLIKKKIAGHHSDYKIQDEMKKLWEEHVWWTRNLIISIIDELKDINEVTERLLQNPKQIGTMFKVKYGEKIGNAVDSLITEHLVIGKNLVEAIKQGNTKEAEGLNKKWHKNADDIAMALNKINPMIYNKMHWQEMLYSHLELTAKEVEYRMKHRYKEDIKNFDIIEDQALMMASEMSLGLYD